MKRVTKIDHTADANSKNHKLRVAAYCRVSTDSDAQLESLEAQRAHYEKYILSRDDWEFAGLYYDEGITGTKKEKRPELMRLMADCAARNIDFVITKSISRFSRNTADCLELVRTLQNLGIPIYFEKEYIETALYLISTPNTGLFFVYCSICCGFSGYSETVYCVLSLICRLNLQTDTER